MVTQGLYIGTNRKLVYDFLLVRNSYLGPILHRFGDIAGFFALPSDPTQAVPILGVFPLHQMAHFGVSHRAEALSYSVVKLFSKNSNLCDHGT